jgi:hypothetical protein
VARRLAECIDDPRAPERIQHGLADMLRFRLLMIAAGCEDGIAAVPRGGNDADSLLEHDLPIGCSQPIGTCSSCAPHQADRLPRGA